MPSFTSAVVSEIAPKSRRSEHPGARSAAFRAVKDQVAKLVDTDPSDPNRLGFEVGLEDGDKPLTISAQIKRAAAQLGITVYVRRRGNTITTYKTGVLSAEETAAANTQKKRGPKAKTEPAPVAEAVRSASASAR